MEVLNSTSELWSKIEHKINSLISRAQNERADLEVRWGLDALTYEGECVAKDGTSGGDASAFPTEDGAWMRGYAANGKEKICVARSKCVAACDIVADSVYKSNSIPFTLKWRIPFYTDEDRLAEIKKQVKLRMEEAGIALTMRDALRDGAIYGEYWCCATGDERIIDVPHPSEMYIDPMSPFDTNLAEYVIRRIDSSAYHIKQYLKDPFVDEEVAQKVREKIKHNTEEIHREEDNSFRLRKVGSSGSLYEVWYKTEIEDEEYDIRAVMLNSTLISCVLDPGSRPYKRLAWDVDRVTDYPIGVCDDLRDLQTLLTGSVRAWAANMRLANRIILAGHREYIRKDPEDMFLTNKGITFLDVDPDVRSINDAIQQFHIQSTTTEMLGILPVLQQLADQESGVPRVLQGQEAQAGATAFEVRNRLTAAGKHLGEAVRRHDDMIVWVVSKVLEQLIEEQAINEEEGITVLPCGYSAYSDLVSRLESLVQMLQISQQVPEISNALRKVEVARKIASANDLDINEVLLTDEELQAQAQAQEQEQAQQAEMQQQMLNAEMQLNQSKIDKANAQISQMQDKQNLQRAKFIKEMEKQQNEVQTNRPNTAIINP